MGRYVPINTIDSRQSHLKRGIKSSNGIIYPLYESYTRIYNYDNIRQSLYEWSSYSNNITKNLNRVLELFDIVATNGTKDQLTESTNIINSYIVPYLESPMILKRSIQERLSTHTNQTVDRCLNEVIDQINQEVECDRLIKNYNTISKRFNIDKLMYNNILFEDAFTETLYTLCSLIDTYSMDMKSKFCIATEAALYSINKVDPSIQQKPIVENIVDYFLLEYGHNDIPKFCNDIRECVSKDMFIHDSINEYIDYIDNLYKKMEYVNEDDKFFNTMRDDSLYGLSENMDTYQVLDNSLQSLYEIAILDKAKEIITKIKMVPVKSIAMVKEAIRALLVPFRAQDLVKNIPNALSIVFYTVITLGAFSIGVLPGLMGLITSLLTAKLVQKEYLKDAIGEWREHKYSIQRKIKDCTDSEKRRRLEAYMDEVDKNIDVLEKTYDDIKDKDVSSIQNRSYIGSSTVSPNGKEVPDSGSSGETISHNSQSDSKSQSTGNQSIDDELSEYDEYMRSRGKKG